MKGGILLIDKAGGVTSAKVVAQLKKKFKFSKIGHAGTLDPMATGLLVCLVNSATRIASYAVGGGKRYSGTIDLGTVTDTDDTEGNVISTCEDLPDFSAVQDVARSLTGELQQVPPNVSAVKVNGIRSYQLARKGKESNLKPRSVLVDSFDLEPISQSRVAYQISCSKGTYIRSLARDLGVELGCGACVSSLRRLGSHPFSVTDARSLDNVTLDDILPWYRLFPETPRLAVSAAQAARLMQGDQHILHEVTEGFLGDSVSCDKSIYVDRDSGQALGILLYKSGSWSFGVNLAGMESN